MGTHRRDRDGEPFQDDFTDNEGVRPPDREAADHTLNMTGDQINADDDDASSEEFAEELKGTNINRDVET